MNKITTNGKEYFTWDKGDRAPFNWAFTSSEFDCRCVHASCVKQAVSVDLINKLTAVRTELKSPIKVTSGYRCAKKQQDLRNAGYETSVGPSSHELGNAVDIVSSKMHEMLQEAKKEFKAIGVAKSFIHVDTRDDKLRYWSYST